MGDPGPESGVSLAAMTQEFLVEPQPSHKYKCVPVVDSVHSVQDHGHTLRQGPCDIMIMMNGDCVAS